MNDQLDMRYRYDEVVDFDNGVISARGKIKGISSTEMAVIGVTYIVEVIDGTLPNSTYPYSHLAVQEVFFKK